MLSLERLMEEAKLRSLPPDKKRAIVREYAQVIMLRALYQSKNAIEKLFFLGGTALRLAYDLPRFSEDLDFNGTNLLKSEFEEMLKVAKMGLSKESFESEIALKEKGSLLVGRFKLIDILQKYKIAVMRDEKLIVKFKANRPNQKLEKEGVVMNGFGYSFSSPLMSKGALLSGKLNALLNRRRGRDIYDIIFMLRNKFPLDSKEILLAHIDSLNESELKALADQVKPFLFREEEAELVANAKEVIQSILK